MLLVYLSGAFLAGVFLGSRFVVPPAFFLFALLPLPLAFFIRRYSKLIAASFCLAALLVGAVYYQLRLPLVAETAFSVGWISDLRSEMAEVLARVLPEPQASLAQGIVLGIRGNMPKPLLADFSHTGTTHLLAISGQNLSIFVGILVSFGVWIFGRRYYVYIWLALATLWLYALLTGMQPPVVRGAVMASVFLFADLLGRQRSAFTALAFAAAIMVAVTPSVLWDVSFQLSFLAMSGLIFIYPPLGALGKKIVNEKLGESGWLVSTLNFAVDSLAVSLGAVLAVWPLIAHYFGIIPWVGPLATLFAVPAMPAIIVFGALAGFSGLLFLPLAQVLGWVAWLFLSCMLLIVKVFSFLPFSESVRIDVWLILIYYAVLAAVIWMNSGNGRMEKTLDWLKAGRGKIVSLFLKLSVRWIAPSLAVGAVLVWAAVFSLPDDKLHASFLDVGQGDATLFQKGSQQVLIDGGPRGQTLLVALGEEMPFWDRTIELVVITHPDADHYTGLIEAFRRYKVGQVLYANSDDKPQPYQDLLNLVSEKEIKFTSAQAGQRITFNGANIEVLNPRIPTMNGTGSDDNNNGVVLRVIMGDVSFLMAADIELKAELELVARRATLASAVLRVGHHGSATSSSQLFLDAVNPSVAIISAGEDNSYGHPYKEVLDRLAKKVGTENIYRTDERGKIKLTTDGVNLWVRTEK